jgi:hypothetical protein
MEINRISKVSPFDRLRVTDHFMTDILLNHKTTLLLPVMVSLSNPGKSNDNYLDAPSTGSG